MATSNRWKSCLPGYRLYRLDQKASIVGVEEAFCPSDEAALAHAETLLSEEDGHGFEVWERARLIGRVGPAWSAAPAA